MVTSADPAAAVHSVPAAPVKARRKSRVGFAGWISIGWLGFITIVSALAPVLPLDPPVGPNAPDFENIGVGPFTGGHILGTDDIGRDVLSRLVWGSRASLLVAVGAILFGVLRI